GEEEDEGEDLEDEEQRCGQAVVAGGGKSAAAGHLAHDPAEPKRDREPADERARKAATRATEALVGQGTRDVGGRTTEIGRRRFVGLWLALGACLRASGGVAWRCAGEWAGGGATVLGSIRLTGRAGRRVPPG